MRRSFFSAVLSGCFFWLLTSVITAAPAPPQWARPGALAFTDEVPPVVEPASRQLLTVAGWTMQLSTDAVEGLYIETSPASPAETRWLSIAPPPAIPVETLLKTLPRQGGKLVRGEPFTILAIGDSVTATGPYPEILAKLLARATGNREIRVVKAAYSGKSVDAAVRRWASEGAPAKPDLALIMFGLNDQGAATPVEAYLEQTRWLVERLREVNADVVLLEPTPHINITAFPTDKGPPPPDSAIFRTIGFAGALHTLGRELSVPVAPTFGAIWQGGAPTLQESARRLWPIFPLGYQKPFSSLLEAEGKGDTIHPNVLGHLLLARAIFNTLAGTPATAPLRFEGETRWNGGRLISRLRVKNTTSARRSGRLEAYPSPQGEAHDSLDYALDAGASTVLTVTWPNVSSPEDLLAAPLSHVFAGPGPFVQVVDYRGTGSQVHAVQALLTPNVRWLRERSVAVGGRSVARLQVGNEVREVAVPIPAESAVGRIALRETVEVGGEKITAAAELAYVRYGAARSGEATVDGDLGDWAGAEWSPVGETIQARWTNGVQDHRTTPQEFYQHWSFAAGKDGLYLAFRGTGDATQDRFTVYFDPRPAKELGTAGSYLWIDGVMKPKGVIGVRAGDSSPAGADKGVKAVWKDAGDGVTAGELFVPYAVLGISAWPADGDLGVSIIWQHSHPDGKFTRLMWSENGHPWNARWFGVVRRDPGALLPYRVRIP